MDALATFLAALALTAVQMVPRLLVNLPEPHRRRLHSASGGVAVAFVFLHLFPQLDDLREPVSERIGSMLPFDDQGIFVLALVGLVAFYGIEVFARRCRGGDSNQTTWADHVGIGVFAGYYAVIGYLLWDVNERGADELVTYTVAMGLHFLVVDYGLRETHRGAYAGGGRWALAAAVAAGWVVGWTGRVPDWGLGLVLSLFAGAVVLVALKEELPAERAGHFPAFVTGAAAYAALLAAMGASVG